MILKETYFKEITLDNDSKEEFKEKLGEALDILKKVKGSEYSICLKRKMKLQFALVQQNI